MISKERIELFELYFWNESNDEDTQEWRNDLNIEEKKLISQWDINVNKATSSLCEQIIIKQKFR